MLFLHFWNVSATFWNLQKRPVSQMCVIPFSNLGNFITFGLLWLRCLYYIWTTLLITVHTFAVVIISLHIGKYAILVHLVSLNSKKLGFTLFSLYSHKGWTANSNSSPLSTLCDSDVQYCELYNNIMTHRWSKNYIMTHQHTEAKNHFP